MFKEMPNAPGFFLVENEFTNKADKAIQILYMNTTIEVNRKITKLVLKQEFKYPVFFALWTNPAIVTNTVFKFWFTDEEDYALALMIK